MSFKIKSSSDNTETRLQKNGNTHSVIAHGMKVSGDVDSANDIRIDGEVDGNIFCRAKVIIGEEGNIKGDVTAKNSDVFGTVAGNFYVELMLSLKPGCKIIGNIEAGRLDIAPEAIFNGQCKMMNTTPSQSRVTAGGEIESLA